MYPRLLFGAMVPIAAAVVLAVIVVLNPRPPTPVGSAPPTILPSSGPSASPTFEPSIQPSAEPSAAASPFDMGASGSLIVARPTRDALEIVSIDPSGLERTLTIVALSSAPDSADWHIEDGTRPIYAFADGHLVVEVQRPTGETEEHANAWFDLRRSLDAPIILPAGAATFAPDGTLVIAVEGPGDVGEIRRIIDPTQAAGSSTPMRDPRVSLRSGVQGKFEVTADGTGVFVQRLEADDSTLTQLILRWDGSLVAIDGVQPDLSAGLSRLTGANGELIGVVCVDAPSNSSCGYEVQGPRGSTSIKVLGGDATDAVWAVDGDAVIAIDDKGRVVRWTPSGSTLVGSLPQTGRIVGLTRDVVYVAKIGKGGSQGRTLFRLPLATGSSPLTMDGVFIRVVP